MVLAGYNHLQNFKPPVSNKIMSYKTDSIAGCLPNPLTLAKALHRTGLQDMTRLNFNAVHMSI